MGRPFTLSVLLFTTDALNLVLASATLVFVLLLPQNPSVMLWSTEFRLFSQIHHLPAGPFLGGLPQCHTAAKGTPPHPPYLCLTFLLWTPLHLKSDHVFTQRPLLRVQCKLWKGRNSPHVVGQAHNQYSMNEDAWKNGPGHMTVYPHLCDHMMEAVVTDGQCLGQGFCGCGETPWPP